jgi:hypothetical protein
MRLLPMILVAACVGCGAQGSTQTEAASSALSSEDTNPNPALFALSSEDTNPNPALFEKDARPYGKSIERWSELVWSYIYAQPFDHNPFLDTTGADCAIGQEGPVWFLPAVPGSTLGTVVTRSCTIPPHRALILQLASTMNDYPCPDPAFKPAPGQSLYDFLISAITPLIDQVTGFAVTLDGVEIKSVLSYRFTSDDLFLFTGDLSLQQPFDNCVTGMAQPGVADGICLMFKPLPPGPHTIVVHGQDMHGTKVTLTENLTIE